MLVIPGRIPIKVSPFFWLLAFAIGWLQSQNIASPMMQFASTFIWVLVIIVSVMIHEYGHALTAVFFGQQASIELAGLGGVTQRQGPKLKLWQDFIVVLCGPIFGLILALFALFLWNLAGKNHNNLWTYALEITAYANIFWTVVNLLPVHPLDGWKLLSIILEGIFGIRGIKISLFLSLLLAGFVSILFFLQKEIFLGSLFLLLAFESYRSWKDALILTENDQDSNLQQVLKEAQQEFLSGNLEDSYKKFKDVRDKAAAGVLNITAAQYMAHILSKQGKYKEAFDLLYPYNANLNDDSLKLLQQLAYFNENLTAAINLGDRSYRLRPNYETALINALSHALLDHARPAIGWLKRAIQDGMPTPRLVLTKKEFDKIRGDPEFQELSKKYNA